MGAGKMLGVVKKAAAVQPMADRLVNIWPPGTDWERCCIRQDQLRGGGKLGE